jgi:hypothetical protein
MESNWCTGGQTDDVQRNTYLQWLLYNHIQQTLEIDLCRAVMTESDVPLGEQMTGAENSSPTMRRRNILAGKLNVRAHKLRKLLVLIAISHISRFSSSLVKKPAMDKGYIYIYHESSICQR